jgi:hypothetical protein
VTPFSQGNQVLTEKSIATKELVSIAIRKGNFFYLVGGRGFISFSQRAIHLESGKTFHYNISIRNQ